MVAVKTVWRPIEQVDLSQRLGSMEILTGVRPSRWYHSIYTMKHPSGAEDSIDGTAGRLAGNTTVSTGDEDLPHRVKYTPDNGSSLQCSILSKEDLFESESRVLPLSLHSSVPSILAVYAVTARDRTGAIFAGISGHQ